MKQRQPVMTTPWRFGAVMVLLACAFALLSLRAVDLQVFSTHFLQGEGEARHLRTIGITAHRGMISDRHGEPLAISTPVDSVWVNPKEFMPVRDQWPQLAKLLGMPLSSIDDVVSHRKDKEFVYLKRRVLPEVAARINAAMLPGVYLQREYRRYYPAGEVASHVIGFTNIDDKGQEGLELAYDSWLRGKDGSKRVIKDRLGRIVEDVEAIQPVLAGKNLQLSLDRRIQYLAYRELKSAVAEHGARSGSVVVLDARTAEVLAMVNQPAFNPNNRHDLIGERYRNRAVTDIYEPGSTIKPFTIAAALRSGVFRADAKINTSPGFYYLGEHVVKDPHDYGYIDLSTVIQKSSNVGASKVALAVPAGQLWESFALLGFGAPTGSGFPGESHGQLSDYGSWSEFEQATLAFGYGLSVTPLQLAHAYTVLAGDGRLRPVSFVKRKMKEVEQSAGDAIFSPYVLNSVRKMMEGVVSVKGTGRRARVSGYRVAGKTGTVKKNAVGGYTDNRYVAVFAGMAPASNPRLVMVVLINEPSNGHYYGGRVAAPVFSKVMSGALRLLDIPPDDLPAQATLSAQQGSLL